jgi:glycerophosphoryl diester phosphodiesterase
MDANYLVAHRGWRQHFPENTLPAIDGALQAGALNIEIDVQLSADQMPLLFHDRTLHRICRQRGELHQYTAQQLQQFSAYEPDRFGDKFLGTRITELNDVIALFEKNPQAHLFLEVKEEALHVFGNEAVYRALQPLIERIRERCTLISFAHTFLQFAKTQSWPRVGPVLNTWEEIDSPTLAALQPTVVFCDIDQLPRQRDLHLIPYPLVVYEVPDIDTAEKLRARGVAKLETFKVGELLKQPQ